ncbi:MAG TPA: sigma-54-dependent Fis family transcriptional regulator, partial [Thermodesulfobacterium commune]|nr:sigma-54-dependent Fis family transcriptional regulator [Thermodesulfobacterium commune]
VRFLAATNRDIEKEVKEGRFRSDLFYRLNVITVKIPPLRERKEDVKFLSKFFLEKFSRMYKKSLQGFSEEAQRFLMDYSFPGNVRELKNMIERAVLTCEGELIEVKHLIDPFSQSENLVHYLGINFDNKQTEIEVKPLEVLEKEAIMKALEVAKGNKTKAAELLGITVRTLRNKLKQYKNEKGFEGRF